MQEFSCWGWNWNCRILLPHSVTAYWFDIDQFQLFFLSFPFLYTHALSFQFQCFPFLSLHIWSIFLSKLTSLYLQRWERGGVQAVKWKGPNSIIWWWLSVGKGYKYLWLVFFRFTQVLRPFLVRFVSIYLSLDRLLHHLSPHCFKVARFFLLYSEIRPLWEKLDFISYFYFLLLRFFDYCLPEFI